MCDKHNNDVERAFAEATCLALTWKMGDAAKAGCDTNTTQAVRDYTACISKSTALPDKGVALCVAGEFDRVELMVKCFANARSYLPDKGAALCGAGEFEKAETSVACVKKCLKSFATDLRLGHYPGIARGKEMCDKHNN